MQQNSLNNYISDVLTNFGIENKIVRDPDDPRSSFYRIIVKLESNNLIFQTFAYNCSSDPVELCCCFFENPYQDFFDMEFEKYYDTRFINSSSCTAESTIKLGLNVENEIKEYTKENIIQTLKQLKLIEQ